MSGVVSLLTSDDEADEAAHEYALAPPHQQNPATETAAHQLVVYVPPPAPPPAPMSFDDACVQAVAQAEAQVAKEKGAVALAAAAGAAAGRAAAARVQSIEDAAVAEAIGFVRPVTDRQRKLMSNLGVKPETLREINSSSSASLVIERILQVRATQQAALQQGAAALG